MRRVLITTLAPAPYELSEPIEATVRRSGGSYVASFVAANVNASGETLQMAIDNLKELIVMFHENLRGHGEESLGPAMIRQKGVLSRLLLHPTTEI